jgi:hypothetical protein
MTLLLKTRHVREWFAKYGATLDDRHSYRIQAEIVRREVAELEPLIAEYRAADMAEEADELIADLAAARTLLADLDRRSAFATEPTEQGNQYVMPGCEKDRSRGPRQMDLF